MTDLIANAITTKLTEYIPVYQEKIKAGIRTGVQKMSAQQAQIFISTWNAIGKVVEEEVAKKQQAIASPASPQSSSPGGPGALPPPPGPAPGGPVTAGRSRRKRNKKTLKRKSH